MNVKELIERLAQEDQQMRVVVDGYESGYDELDTVCFTRIAPNPESKVKEWEGEFKEVDAKSIETEFEVALYLPRKS